MTSCSSFMYAVFSLRFLKILIINFKMFSSIPYIIYFVWFLFHLCFSLYVSFWRLPQSGNPLLERMRQVLVLPVIRKEDDTEVPSHHKQLENWKKKGEETLFRYRPVGSIGLWSWRKGEQVRGAFHYVGLCLEIMPRLRFTEGNVVWIFVTSKSHV